MRFNSMRVSRAFRVFVCWVTGIGGRAERRISSVVSVGYQDAPGAKVRAPHALARATSVTRGNPAVVCVPEMELRPVATDHFRAPDTSMARFGLLLRLMSEPPPIYASARGRRVPSGGRAEYGSLYSNHTRTRTPAYNERSPKTEMVTISAATLACGVHQILHVITFRLGPA